MENLPKFNVNAMRMGWYADKYFLRTQEILSKDNYDGIVHYQYFPRKNCVVCGIPHVIDILKKCIGYYSNRNEAWQLFSAIKNFNVTGDIDSDLMANQYLLALENLWISKSHEVEIFSVKEGSEVLNMEPVIGLIGNPKYFAHLETPTLGVLAQQSAVATSVRRVLQALNPNQSLLFFPARFRHYASQAPDGYAAVVGGVKHMSTDSNGEYWGYSGIGTIPHLLIAAYEGNTALAALKFDEYIDPNIDRVILVDWDNDCIETTLQVILAMIQRYFLLNPWAADKGSMKQYCENIRKLSTYEIIKEIRSYSHHFKGVIGKGKGKIFGVRFDTSGSLVDKTFTFESYKGVCPELVKKARAEFNDLGLHDLKIIVSGGFDLEKIERFQNLNTPVDIFGIGSSIVNKFTVDFTADAVTLNGVHNAKVGRGIGDWSKMKPEEI